jgi:hypothetical protein
MTNSDAGRQRVAELEEAAKRRSGLLLSRDAARRIVVRVIYFFIFLFLFLFSCPEVTGQVRAAARRRAFSMRAFNEKNNG